MRTFLNVILRVMIGAGLIENTPQPPRRKYARQEIISFRGEKKLYPKAASTDILWPADGLIKV